MNTQHFRYAVEVERTGSISQAAENLYIGQPTLSKVIKELEDTLGITIFKRTSRGTVATEKGAQFLRYAREILAQVDKMEQLSHPETDERPILRVIVPHADYILSAAADFLSGLRAEAGMRIRIEETDAMTALRAVQEERTELAVIRYSTTHETYFTDYMASAGLENELLWEFDPVLVTAEGGMLAENPVITEDMLRDYIEISSGDGRVPYLSGEDFRGGAGREIAVCMQAERLALLTRIGGSFLYSSPVPGGRLARYGLVQRKAPQSGRRWRDVIVWRSGRVFSHSERAFIDRLYRAKNEAAFRPVFKE